MASTKGAANGELMSQHRAQKYIHAKTQFCGGDGYLDKKNWRKIWPKNGLKSPKIAKIWPKNGLKLPKMA